MTAGHPVTFNILKGNCHHKHLLIVIHATLVINFNFCFCFLAVKLFLNLLFLSLLFMCLFFSLKLIFSPLFCIHHHQAHKIKKIMSRKVQI